MTLNPSATGSRATLTIYLRQAMKLIGKKVQFKIKRHWIGLAVERLETLLPEVRAALTRLKDVAVADATEDIEKTLQKVGIHVAECNTLVLFSSFIWC